MRRYRRHPDLTNDELITLNRVESELKLRGVRQENAEILHGMLPPFPAMETALSR